MKDGLVLFYSKDNTLYPTMLTKEQLDIFEFAIPSLLGKLKVCLDLPQGKTVNLLKMKKEKNI